MLHLTHDQQNAFNIAVIITILVMGFGLILLSVLKKSLFGFFATLGAFTLTIGGILMFNAQYDVAHHFVPYKVIGGIATMKPGTVLFWANIPQLIIDAFIAIGVICVPLATTTALVKKAQVDRKLKRLAKLEKERAELVKMGVVEADQVAINVKAKRPTRNRTKKPAATPVA